MKNKLKVRNFIYLIPFGISHKPLIMTLQSLRILFEVLCLVVESLYEIIVLVDNVFRL